MSPDLIKPKDFFPDNILWMQSLINRKKCPGEDKGAVLLSWQVTVPLVFSFITFGLNTPE